MLAAALIGWALGLALSPYLAGSPWLLWALVPFARWEAPPRARAAVLALILVLPAAWWAHVRAPQPVPHDISQLAPRRYLPLDGVVSSPPEQVPDGWRAEIAVQRAGWGGGDVAGGSVVATWPSEGRPAVGDAWRFRGRLKAPSGPDNPGDFDYAAYLARKGIFATFRAVEARVLGPAPGWWAPAMLDRLRMRLLNGLSQGLAPGHAALLGSLVLGGGASPVETKTADAFRQVGLSHLLAASGAQVALLSGLGFGSLRRIGCSPLMAATGTLPGLLLYLALTGAPGSMVRATLMGAIALLGLALGRSAVPFAALYASALFMLVIDPGWAWDLGFQFSLLATYGLCRLAGGLAERESPGPRWLASALGVPVAAWLWVTPWQLYAFQQGSWLALPANWLTAPLVLALTPWGLAVAALGVVWPAAAAIANVLSTLALSGLTTLVGAIAGISWGSFVVAALPVPVVVLSYCALWSGFRRPLLTAACLCAAWPASWVGAEPPGLLVAFLSVGQGDAVAIRTPDGRWALIDGGPAQPGFDGGERTVLPFLRRMGCKRIELVVASHAHLDHVGGLPAIAAQLPVAHAWDPGQVEDDTPYQALLASWLFQGIPWTIAHPGVSWLQAGVGLEALSIPAPDASTNDGSIVVRLTYGAFSTLLVGDLEAEGERRLLARGVRLQADVLKVGHHGSRTSTTPAFLAAVRPRTAVISVGRSNTFGHPNAGVVARLTESGAQVYRTDEDGAVLIRSDGASYRVATRTENWRPAAEASR